jgi:H+/Cl- antiporter ClcA/CBS domain-containing protein
MTSSRARPIDRRVVFLSVLGVGLGLAGGVIARLLMSLIALCTNLSFFGRFSFAPASPIDHQLGRGVVMVPVIGAVLVGLMARYGSKAIRGHGIPEAMEQILTNESRIPPRMTLLKPISAAISIGTGGPFGAEGPIIATGGALGSLVGQVLRVTSGERKTLLAAGAAAGMSAIFGAPVSAVLLAVELLLFEYRPRSLIPVALASTAACGVRLALFGAAPAFAMPVIQQPGGAALAFYVFLGALSGLLAVFVTWAVYAIEDGFETLPIHWMWWPALGAVVVGAIGFVAPRTLGVGYDNIERALSGDVPLTVLATLTLLKFISWSIALGSGTSGGTLAPLFTIGGGLGGVLGGLVAREWPSLGIDPRIAALVGMAALFAGASHALLASVVFAFETTRQPMGLLPLLGGCAMAYLIAGLLRQNSIMTEKIARRGVHVSSEYASDLLATLKVNDFATRPAVSLAATQTVGAVLDETVGSAAVHHGYPVLDAAGAILGVVTRNQLASADRTATIASLVRAPPFRIRPTESLREAVTLMTLHHVGRLLVVSETDASHLEGVLTRADVLRAHGLTLRESELAAASIGLPWVRRG